MSFLLSYSNYFPHFQIEEKILSPKFGKKGKRSVCYVDEDIITLAYEAAKQCLTNHQSSINNHQSDIGAVFFATTTPVFKNRYHASFLADLLELPKEILALDFGSTSRAGTDALLFANQLIDAGVHKNILVVASEIHFPEVGEEARNSFGHAACAILLGKENGIAEIKSVQSFSGNIAEEFIYKNTSVKLDPRFSRDEGFKTNIKSALGKSKINPKDIDAVILNSLYAKLAGGIFFKAGFSEEQFAKDNISFHSGYTGVCHALLQLNNTIESGKKNILLFDYFNGTNVFKIEKTFSSLSKEDSTPSLSPLGRAGEGLSYHDYLTVRKVCDFNSLTYKSSEMFSSEMMNEREKETIIWLKGFECAECKTIYFIKSARCKKCTCNQFSLKKLQEKGTVFSLTKEFYFPHSFAPITMAIIDLDGGGRVTVQMTDDMYMEEKNKIQIGSRVKLVVRKMMENGAKSDYFWKGKIIHN